MDQTAIAHRVRPHIPTIDELFALSNLLDGATPQNVQRFRTVYARVRRPDLSVVAEDIWLAAVERAIGPEQWRRTLHSLIIRAFIDLWARALHMKEVRSEVAAGLLLLEAPDETTTTLIRDSVLGWTDDLLQSAPELHAAWAYIVKNASQLVPSPPSDLSDGNLQGWIGTAARRAASRLEQEKRASRKMGEVLWWFMGDLAIICASFSLHNPGINNAFDPIRNTRPSFSAFACRAFAIARSAIEDARMGAAGKHQGDLHQLSHRLAWNSAAQSNTLSNYFFTNVRPAVQSYEASLSLPNVN